MLIMNIKKISFVVMTVFFAVVLSSAHVVGSDAVELQTPVDSLIAPNIFAPNRSGNNAFFEVKSKEGNPVLLKVFDRSGTLLFSTEDNKANRWDGRSLDGQEVPGGVYFYVAEVSNVSPKITKTGSVVLIREQNE